MLDYTPDALGGADLPPLPVANARWHLPWRDTEWDPALHAVRATMEFADAFATWQPLLTARITGGVIAAYPGYPLYPNVGRPLLGWQIGGAVTQAIAETFIKAELEYLQELMRDDRDRYMPELLSQADGAPMSWISLMRIDRGQMPWTLALMSIALRIGEMVAMYYKNIYKRTRPSTLFPGLLVPFGPPLHPAFPSGHALQSALLSLLLKRINANTLARFGVELNWLASRVAKGRERAGLHYPSDTQAGIVLATGIDGLLTKGGGGVAPVPSAVLDMVMTNAALEWPN